MTEVWKQWEGQVVCGRIHLSQYLGGCENSAVFLASYGEQGLERVTIKLIAVPPERMESQLSLWNRTANLSHPHLIRLLETGQCHIGTTDLLYVVMEYADENLAQILPQRSLTLTEAREMLEPVLNVLGYLHSQGFVHGRIKPTNIMGVQDQLKVSSEQIYARDEFRSGLRKPGSYDAPEIVGGEISPAADVWSLGMMLVEALTQRLPVWDGSKEREPVLPDTLPAQFRELAHHCLQTDGQNRWTLADIAAYMQQTSSAPANRIVTTRRARFANWHYVAPLLALGLILVALVATRLFKHHANIQQSATAVAEQPKSKPQEAPNQVTPGSGQPTQIAGGQKPALPAVPQQLSAQSESASSMSNVGLVPGEVVHQVIPDVPRQARGTIRGTVRVSIRVRIDPSGNVLAARVDASGPSRYFAELALKAAGRWKFSPAIVDGRQVSSEWILRFGFGRSVTKVVPVRTAP
jgi:TonB family protein